MISDSEKEILNKIPINLKKEIIQESHVKII